MVFNNFIGSQTNKKKIKEAASKPFISFKHWALMNK